MKYTFLIISFFCHFITLAQLTQNHVEVRVRNDDAGEISNWLHSGDDVGETQSFLLSVNLFDIHPKFNYRVKIESTEYSKLNEGTLEPRDIFFKEVNRFNLSIDNNKFQNNTFFYSLGTGLYYIQSNKLTIGATGQKYYWHKWLINNFYENKYWIYHPIMNKDLYLPYIELKYGYNRSFFESKRFVLNTITNAEGQLCSNSNYSGIGARTYFNFRIMNEKFKMHALDIECEAFYFTDISNYQVAYFQMGPRVNFKRFSAYIQFNQPIKKNLDNSIIIYDDMEILFNYGLTFNIRNRN